MSTPSIRHALHGLAPRPGTQVDQPGLLLDRYLAAVESGQGEKPALDALYQAVTSSMVPGLYHAAYARWRDVLSALPGGAGAQYEVRGRLIVGLGAESVRETSIVLHRAWGVPVIPGSALKGLARRYLEHHFPAGTPDGQALKREYRDVLFGSTAKAGYVTFFDAWYVPGSAPGDRPLGLDTITVHHPRYYNAVPGARREPWDFDDPTPIPFLSARGSFLVAVRGPDEAWASAALDLLSDALADWGVGAKTSSGYGRLHETANERIVVRGASSVAPEAAMAVPTRPAVPDPPEHPLITQIRALRTQNVRPQIRGLFDQWRRLSAGEPARRRVAEAIVAKLEEARMWEHPPDWARELRAFLDEMEGG